MVCVSVVADVCILSGRELKINRFFGKDAEVFSKACVLPTKTLGKKIVVFLARWLGTPVPKPKKHPGHVGRRLFDSVLCQVRLAGVK